MLVNTESGILMALTQAESAVAAVGQALVLGQPELVEASARDLHDSAHCLALALRDIDASPPMAEKLHRRLHVVAQGLAMQREALLRRAAVVEQSLVSLLPQARATTYGGALGAYGGGKRAGAFRAF